MVRIIRKQIILIFIMIISIFSSQIVIANKPLVFDDAGLFTQDQVQQLDIDANALSEEYNMDIVIVTTDNTDGKSSREYADDYFDNGKFGVGYGYDGILFLIDTDNREAYISTSGTGIRYLTDERIERVLDVVFDSGLSNGDYYGASMGFLRGTKTYLERGIPSDQYNEPEVVVVENRLTMSEFIFSFVGGIIISGIFFITTMSKYKMKKSPNYFSYKNNSIVNFSSNDNKLIDTFITHRVIPKPTNNSNSSSGRSSTHTSSSGKTHGGGGRKF